MDTTTMTLAEAHEYVEQACECEAENKAEYGMGAVSLGYDGNQAMAYYDGYRCSEDEAYAAAKAIIAEASVVRVMYVNHPYFAYQSPTMKPTWALATDDDLPF